VLKNFKKQIDHLGPIIPGTIRKVFLRCGRKNCVCASGNEEDKHGPYHFWAFKDGKRLTSISIGEDEVTVFEEWIENRKKLESIVAEMLAAGAARVVRERKK
jgi:hypothetical protein